MKKILVLITFSKASKNSLRHAASIDQKIELTLLHVFPAQSYSRKYNFGKKKYDQGIREKLIKFYHQNYKESHPKTNFLALPGIASQTIDQISGNYDLLVLSRKEHPSKKNGYFSEKKLYITAKAHCPALIVPISDTPFKFNQCKHIWHIKRNESETEVVKKGLAKLKIKPEKMEVKTLQQSNILSAFCENILAYESSHNKRLLKKIDKAHDEEPINLIVIVDNEESLFTRFLKSDIIHLFCKYNIPILVFPNH